VGSRYFLGVDGGGSKTSAIVVDEKMQPLGGAVSGPSNHLRVGIDEAARNVESAIRSAISSSPVQLEAIEYAYCGIAGSDHPIHRQRVIDSLRYLFPRSNFTVDSDARIALTSGVGFGPGIVVIAGTGSVAFGRNESLAEARAGGWGPTLGDEGSGYSIARRGLSAVVRAHDGRSPTTQITELLCAHYGMCDPVDLPYFVYAPSTHADDIALYCRLVFEAAQQGDSVAKEIVEGEGTELGIMVAAVASKLHMADAPIPVAWVGGAFQGGPLLLDPLSRVLAARVPHASLQPALETPVMGAARMAIRGAISARPSRKP
jgi:glucosamine kinase